MDRSHIPIDLSEKIPTKICFYSVRLTTSAYSTSGGPSALSSPKYGIYGNNAGMVTLSFYEYCPIIPKPLVHPTVKIIYTSSFEDD